MKEIKKGKFIVIEGLDGCGKSTVSAILKRNYNAIGLNAIPKELKPWLNVVGNTNLPEATFSYFTICNLLKSLEIEKIISTGKNVILDRYVYSTYVYHKELLGNKIPEEVKEIYHKIIQPDLVIFLDVPQNIRKERINQRVGDLQWYGDAISLKTDLTNSYFELFSDLKTNVIKVDNYKNNVSQTIEIIRNEMVIQQFFKSTTKEAI